MKRKLKIAIAFILCHLHCMINLYDGYRVDIDRWEDGVIKNISLGRIFYKRWCTWKHYYISGSRPNYLNKLP